MPLYALVGVLATAVHYLVLVTLVELAGFQAGIAATAGAFAGYTLNRRWSFA